jgi:hypothetical protein
MICAVPSALSRRLQPAPHRPIRRLTVKRRATRTAMNAADREVGMPRIVNFAQKKLLKNAYEDMDQTTVTYVYSQALDGKFVCLGQAIGYGVSLGTQFTASQYPELVNVQRL